MKTCFLNVLITILGIICGLLPSSANDTFQFELTPDKLDSTWVCESADGCYGVRVLLKDPYRKYFSALTAHHIGEELSITYSNLTLFTSVVMTKIDSGAIHIGNCDSKEDAERLVETLQGKSEKNTNNESENWKKTKACERTVATEYVKDGIKHLNEFRSTDNRAFLIEALESTEKALKADNDYCLGYYWKAVILAKSEDYQKAILTLNEGIEKPCENINDKIGSFYFLRGMIKHKAGEKEIAFEDYDIVLEFYKRRLSVDPKNCDAIMNIAQALTLMNKKTEALQFLKGRIEANPQEEVLKQILNAIEKFDAAEHIDTI